MGGGLGLSLIARAMRGGRDGKWGIGTQVISGGSGSGSGFGFGGAGGGSGNGEFRLNGSSVSGVGC